MEIKTIENVTITSDGSISITSEGIFGQNLVITKNNPASLSKEAQTASMNQRDTPVDVQDGGEI